MRSCPQARSAGSWRSSPRSPGCSPAWPRSSCYGPLASSRRAAPVADGRMTPARRSRARRGPGEREGPTVHAADQRRAHREHARRGRLEHPSRHRLHAGRRHYAVPMTNTHPTPVEHALELASDARRLVQRLRGRLVAADLDSARQRLQSTGTAAVQALDAELADLQADDRRRVISWPPFGADLSTNPQPKVECSQ